MEAPARMRRVRRRRFTTLTGEYAGESMCMTLPAVPFERDDVRGVLHGGAGAGLHARVAEAVEPVGKVPHVPGGEVVAHVERHGALSKTVWEFRAPRRGTMSESDSQRPNSSVRLAPRPHKQRLPLHEQAPITTPQRMYSSLLLVCLGCYRG